MAKHTFSKDRKRIDKTEISKPKNEFSMENISEKDNYTSIRVKKNTATLWNALVWVLDKPSLNALMDDIGQKIYDDLDDDNKIMFELYLKKKNKK